MSKKTLVKEKNKSKFSDFLLYMKGNWQLYVFLLPAFLFFLLFSYYPMLGIQIAFKDWNPNLGIWGSHWAKNADGSLNLLKHFKTIFQDEYVFVTLKNTLRLSSLRLVFGFLPPIIIVILMNEMRTPRLKKSIQTLTYLPHFVSWIIIAGILQSLTQTDGTLQKIFLKIFGKELHFFGDSDLFIVMLIVSDIWKEAGWGTIIYLAAIGGIDPSIEEAAMIDGAGRWQRIKHVIFPGILPAISINLIFACSGLIYGGFDQVFNLYNTAVYPKGDILETYLYRIGVGNGKYSLSTAIGLFNSTVSFALMLIANKVVGKLGGATVW